MQSHARAVIIGGGIAGCSALYHLTQEGWTDVVLVERDELTSGSTWHAAAQVTQFGGNQTMVALKRHSIDLYQRLAANPDHPFDHHITGGMRLAHTRDQLDTYHHHVSLARGVGVEMAVIDAAEVGRRHPLLDTTGLLGAWWDPLDGYIDPNGITQALARQARKAGASVLRQAPVTAIRRKPNGEFVVTVAQGEITCEKLVNAAGYRCNEVGALLGVRHPVTSMEHMYFLTEAMPEIEALDFQVPVIRDPGDDFYSRQEKQGLLVGVYEQACKTFGMDGIDPDFTRALCPSDLDRCLDNMERIFERMPALQNTGIHTVVNGPITYTIDGLPLVGPVPGVPGYYCITGLRAGIGEGGGHGKVLAQTMVHGECEWDAWCLDPRRFSQYANTEFTCLKAIEDYRNEFHYHLPHEHRPAGRLARTTPLYTTLEAAGAHFGTVAGWERALYFSDDPSVQHVPGFRFDATRAVVAKEVAAVRDAVGVMEVSGFNRYELQGPGAAEMLDRLVCGAIPRTPGQVRLCYLLNPHGHLLAEATLVCLSEDHYWVGSAAAAEWHDRDWLMQHKPDTVQLIERAATHTALVVAGPRSRALLQSLAPRADFDAAAFRPMQARWVMIGHAECLAMRVSYSGELAWELHVPNEQLLLMWRTLMTTAEEFSLRPFGLFAAESMRVEKGFFHWKAELITERNPMELGLARFVDLDKDFIGRAALQAEIARGDRRRIAALRVESDIAPLHAGDSLYDGDRLVGTVTAGAWGHRVGANLALALIEPDCAVEGQVLGADLLGERVRATLGPACHYDPGHARVRA